MLTRFRFANSHHPIIIVGDFNVHEHEWLGSSFTSATGAALHGFYELYGLTQLVDQGTCKDAILDLAISEYTGTVSYHPHLETSDHVVILVRVYMCQLRYFLEEYIIASLLHEITSVATFIKPIGNQFKSEPISDAMDTFVNVLTEVRDHYMPSTIATVKHPTVWWNHFCQYTYQGKPQSWSRCDWPAYCTCVLTAKRAQGIACHHY